MKDELLSMKAFLNPSISYVYYQTETLWKRHQSEGRQNAFSFLSKVEIENETAEDIQNAVLRIDVQPNVIQFEDVHVSCLEKGKETIVDRFKYTLDPLCLYRLSERMPCSFTFRLIDKNGDVLVTETAEASLLPIGESAGSGRIDEILASFVTPNDRLVKETVALAATKMKEKYGTDAFAGYQYHDSNKVLEQLDALYLAVASLDIRYSNPPASFEKAFQRVRLPHEVLSDRVGTCLELSLLMASLAESIGLRPLIVLFDNHAIFGCWLDEEIYSVAREDNGTRLLNMASKGFNHLALIEAVNLTNDNMNFQESLEKGYEKMQTAKLFRYAIDVDAARKEKILPLPGFDVKDGDIVLEPLEGRNSSYDLPLIDAAERRYLDENAKSSANRFDFWEEKLLDLNLKNRLINLPFGTTGMQFLVPEAEGLFSCLSKNERISIAPSPYLTDQKPKRGEVLFFPSSSFKEQAESNYQRATLLSVKRGVTDHDSYFKNLSRKSNTAIEESGCNPLFLTIGLIKWFDNDKAASHGTGAMYAPIFLLPVKMPRRRVGNLFSFEYSFEDLQLNTTIFEYFRQTFGLDFSPLIGPMKTKADGSIDFRLIYNAIRQIIAEKRGWSLIEETSVMSLFSFAHFVMWNDIKTRRKKLLENKIVSALVSGVAAWEETPGLIAETELDEKVTPEQLACPLPADSSQIKAIIDAEKGESFVLDGPPGTGKSQTIANMIVNFLYHGKTVLFVAEKEVALDVVKKRLEELGLGDFCLQLANPSGMKGQALSQIGRQLDLGQTKEVEDYLSVAADILEKRKEINKTLENLHEKGDYVFSPYEAIVTYLAAKNDCSLELEFSPLYAKSLDEEGYRKTLTAIVSLERADERAGGFSNNPFRPYFSRDYSLDKRASLLRELPRLEEQYRALELATFNFLKNKPFFSSTRHDIFALADIFGKLRSSTEMYWEYLGEETVFENRVSINVGLENLRKHLERKEELLVDFKESVLAHAGDDLLIEYIEALESPFFQRKKRLKKIRKLLQPHLETGKKAIRGRKLGTFVNGLSEYRKESQALEEAEPFAKLFIKRFPIASSTEAESVRNRLLKTFEVSELILSLKPAKGHAKGEIAKFFFSLKNDIGFLLSAPVNGLMKEVEALDRLEEELKTHHDFDPELYPDSSSFFKKAASLVRKAREEEGKLGDWVRLLLSMDEAREIVPAELLLMYEDGKAKARDLMPLYQKALSYRIINLSLLELGLSTLDAADTERDIKSYQEKIAEFSRLTVLETAARLTASFPSVSKNMAQSTTAYKLKKLAKNGGRGVSLRTIFSEFGSLIHDLCPCFLMSPLAVAQYLGAEDKPFDVVIFDEASQIPTSEAVGAIARGTSCVIAGDQEQMPPSNYFSSLVTLGDIGDGLYSLDEDLESLLDDAIVLGFPRKRLIWHYRSRKESLIAFSNRKFYENSLLTFPSPSGEKTGVTFRYVNGRYEKGRGVNKTEAEAIVKEIVRRLKSKELSKHSIGVVTFNEAQQNLVEDMLEKAMSKMSVQSQTPGGETIFVKNLENVQGDERDVILFSVCYGPDKETGNVSLNFGPLSRAKGERRLNVAVSRSREEMIVFSSVYPEQIAAERAKNEGASYLRDFLSFAMKGVGFLPNNAIDRHRGNKPSVASFLAQDLKKHGFDVELDVGASTFKIDLAIKDKDNPDRYLLGIVMDGESYVDCPTCRDRNVVQPEALRRLGWRILRLWSAEYFDHPNECLSLIIRSLNEGGEAVETGGEQTPIRLEKKRRATHKNATRYLKYPTDNPKAYPPQTDEEGLRRFVSEVLQLEYPLAKKTLYERYRERYGRLAVTATDRGLIGKALQSISHYVGEVSSGEEFYYPDEKSFYDYRFYRLPEPNERRDVTSVSFVELGNAYRDILEEQGAMMEDDLYKQASLLFGNAALTQKAKEHLGKALRYNSYRRLNIVLEDDGMVKIDE